MKGSLQSGKSLHLFSIIYPHSGRGEGGDGGGCRSWREGGGLSGAMKRKVIFFFSLTQPEGLWEYAIRHDEMKMELSQRVDYESMMSGQ